MGEFVDDVEQADFTPVMGALLEEVVGPDVVGALGPQPDAYDPSFSHRRPRFGCLAGTFSPSRRQIRSTRLSLTSQPAWRSNSAILR